MWATSCRRAVRHRSGVHRAASRLRRVRDAARRRPHRQPETVSDAAEIEPALAAIFANAADRRFAARELLRFLEAERNAGRAQSNVGAIARATVRLDAIEREHSGSRCWLDGRRRCARLHGRAAAARPQTMPLFTASDLAAVKPLFVVRTRERVSSAAAVVRRALPSGVSIDRARLAASRDRGDRVLLAAAHLLTAVGFAVLLSRVDPLRDNLLFVRYARRRPRRPAADHGVVARRFRDRHVPRAQLSAAHRRAVAVGAVDPVRHRPGTKQRQGEPRPGAADRGDPPAARVVSRRVLRPPLGVAQGPARRSHPHGDGAGLAQRAARRIRAAGSGRSRHGARVLLSAEGSRPGAVAVVRVPGGVRRRPRPDRAGRGGVRVAGGRLLCRLPA